MRRAVKVLDLKTTNENIIVRAEVNYSDNPRFARGYYLFITPVEQRSIGGIAQEITATGGGQALIEEAKRFSQRTLNALAIGTFNTKVYRTLLAEVLEKNKLTLV